MTPLHYLPKGWTTTISSLTAKGATRRRLMDLGFTEGSTVTAIRKSPLGDPTAYLIRGSVIALRQEDASQIKINWCNSSPNATKPQEINL